MTSVLLEQAFDGLECDVAAGLVPGAAAAVGTADGTLRRAWYGCAQMEPERRALTEDALFDLASLTKVVATTSVALRLVERGTIFLGQRIASVLPAFGGVGKDAIMVRHLLTHTSGLQSGLAPVHAVRAQMLAADSAVEVRMLSKARVPGLDVICGLPLQRPVGTAVFYSDSGFFALGAFLAAAAGEPLDALVRREVCGPLGMRETRFRPTAAMRAWAVSTEVVPGRGGAVTGEVHDEMAALAGGVAGHAGLFSTLGDLERFCRAWLRRGELDGSRFLSGATCELATRDQTHTVIDGGGVDVEGRPAHRGLGWNVPPNPRWHGGDLCSPAVYGHAGFTGTSLLIDPVYGIYVVLLTNRVHPTRGGDSDARSRTVRLRFYNRVWAALS